MRNRNFARYVHNLIKLRRRLSVFKNEHFFTGQPVNKKGFKDLAWYTEKGTEFSHDDWNTANRKSLAYLTYVPGRLLLVIFNAHDKAVKWTLPLLKRTKKWKAVFETSGKFDLETSLESGKAIEIPAWSVMAIEIGV